MSVFESRRIMTSRIGYLVRSSSIIIWAALFSGLMLFGSFFAGSLSAAAEPPKAKGGNQPLFRLPDFRARNAIDGMTQNGHHGIWPYQSWGPELRNDLWWKVDFGRPVELDKIRLMVRADFPHDSYWQSAVIEFSDGTQLPIQITQFAEFQEFTFPRRTVSWVRLNKLVPADPARWCSFIEVEAWGHDLK